MCTIIRLGLQLPSLMTPNSDNQPKDYSFMVAAQEENISCKTLLQGEISVVPKNFILRISQLLCDVLPGAVQHIVSTSYWR
jgi:hypothetical protein